MQSIRSISSLFAFNKLIRVIHLFFIAILAHQFFATVAYAQGIQAVANMSGIPSATEHSQSTKPPAESLLTQSKTDVTIAESKLNILNLELKESVQTIDRIKAEINGLEAKLQNAKLALSESPNNNGLVTELSANLAYQHSILKLEQSRHDVLSRSIQFAEQNLVKEVAYRDKLRANYQLQQQQGQRRDLEQLAEHLQLEQKKWLDKLTVYNQQLQLLTNDDVVKEKQKQLLETQILEAEERSSINHFNLILAQLSNQMEILNKSLAIIQSVNQLNSTNAQVESALRRITSVTSLVKAKIKALQQRLTLEQSERFINNSDTRRMMKGFIDTYQVQLNSFNNLQQQFIDYQKSLRIELGKALAKRQVLPDFNWIAWKAFISKFLVLPELIWQSFHTLLQQVIHIGLGFQWWHWLLLVGYELLLFNLWKLGRLYLKKWYLAYYHQEQPLTKNTFFVVLKLLRRNLFSIVLATNIFSLLAINALPFKSYVLFFSFALVWFGCRFALGLARLALLETMQDIGGEDVALYHKLKWIFSMAAILIALLLAARQLPVDYSVNDFINRLFMLQLLLVSGLLLRSWKVFPTVLNPYLIIKPKYFSRVIRGLSLLIPSALLVNAIIGLVGYVQLAWTMSAYQGIFLLVLLGYLFAYSLLNDLMDLVSNWIVLKLPNGWLWSEAFLRPLDKLLQLCLFFAASVFLLYLYGWDRSSYFIRMIDATIHYPLFYIPGKEQKQAIDIITIFGAIVVILVLSWVARWSREFSYRWLYAYHKDLGVRNSLAVFTQYITVVISIYIALQLSSLDFTGLNYILGGVSLGAGLGLRDLVNNFASGVLLLIERPVKKGDIVTVGAYEGEVTHIGMRAMTIRTWEHMEVLVPNAETFSKAFTNWTYEDMIIRTAIAIKMQRLDNPHEVQNLIFKALKHVPDVLNEPIPSVYMKDLSEPLIEFEVRYFINIQLAGSRSRVRSDVLYAIWEEFKLHGIQPPNITRDVCVKLMNKNTL